MASYDDAGIAVLKQKHAWLWQVWHNGQQVGECNTFTEAMAEAGARALAFPGTLIAVVMR